MIKRILINNTKTNKHDWQLKGKQERVWVNPRDGDCDKFVLLAMAKRVKALGMDLMVDFHYSDWWAILN